MEEVEMEENDDLLQLTPTVSSDNQHKSSPAISSPSVCGIWWRKACLPKKKIEGSRRHEYRPTQKCQDLLGVLVVFSEWGEQWCRTRTVPWWKSIMRTVDIRLA